MKTKKHIIIVGGGFAGLKLIKHLDKSNLYNITLVDINNYNFFPPLLYQVASGFMEPSAISYPYRKILRGMTNTSFRMGELLKIMPDSNKIELDNGILSYDYLVLATGTKSNFFGNKEIEQNALPMKTISDALALRNVVYTRLEKATRENDPKKRASILSFVITGAGPTGVELSGIFSEMKKNILKKDYPELVGHDELGHIYLVDGNDSVLSPMSKNAQKYTKEKLEAFGVKLKLGVRMQSYKDNLVILSDGTEIESENLIWAAGVCSRVFEGIDESKYGRGKRLLTNRFNQVDGYENIFAVGDTALIQGDEDYPNGHPQMAQPAIQQADNLAKNLTKEKSQWTPFSYENKGAMAIIGSNKAVVDGPKNKFFIKGFFAWFAWVFVHVMSLVNFRNRLRALYDWVGYYLHKDQSFRMIIKPRNSENK